MCCLCACMFVWGVCFTVSVNIKWQSLLSSPLCSLGSAICETKARILHAWWLPVPVDPLFLRQALKVPALSETGCMTVRQLANLTNAWKSTLCWFDVCFFSHFPVVFLIKVRYIDQSYLYRDCNTKSTERSYIFTIRHIVALQMGLTVLLFPNKLPQRQDSPSRPQFTVTTAAHLSTELPSQGNGPRNGGLARELSGSSP